MPESQELEAAPRSFETYLAENGGGRPASVQPRSCIRVQEGTGQNYLARTNGNGYVTDKPRMMMLNWLVFSGEYSRLGYIARRSSKEEPLRLMV